MNASPSVLLMVSPARAARVSLWLGLLLPFLVSCSDFGKVDQGRVVAFDTTQQQVTMILDQSPERGKTDYAAMPPRTFKLPTDPNERGALPKVGALLQVEQDPPALLIWSQAQQALQKIPVEQVAVEENIDNRSPKVYDRDARKPLSFPQLDPEKGELQFYLAKQKQLLTVRLPDEARSLPPDTWSFGDEVRIYFKEPAQALRYMNVSRTDIYAK